MLTVITKHLRTTIQFATKDIFQFQFAMFSVNPVNFHLIQATVYCADTLLIRCHLYAGNMRHRAAVCDIDTDSFMENSICNLTDRAILIQVHHGNTSVMVACHKQITILLVHFQIASSHTTCPHRIDWFQISIFQNTERLYTFICNRIKKLSAGRNN